MLITLGILGLRQSGPSLLCVRHCSIEVKRADIRILDFRLTKARKQVLGEREKLARIYT